MKKTLLTMALLQVFALGAVAADFPASQPSAQVTIRAESAHVQDSAINLEQQAVQNSQTVTAEDMGNDWLEKHGGQGWNEDRQRYMAISTAVVKAENDPAKMMRLRESKYMEAVLNARAEIIRFVRTDLSVDNRVTLPDTGLETKLDKEVKALQTELEKAKAQYQDALREVDQVKADSWGGVDIGEFFRDGVAGILNKMGANIDVQGLQAKQAKRLEDAKQKMLSLQGQIDSIKQQIEQAKTSLSQENTSKVATFASMPLVGSAVVYQAESIVDGQYQMSVVVQWSPKQERYMTAVFAQQPVQPVRGGTMSIQDFIRQTDWSSAVGNRLFPDKNGRLHVLGISAWPLTGQSSAARRTAEGMSRSNALAQIGLALKSHVVAKSQADQKVQSMNDDRTDDIHSFAEDLSESLKNFQIQGATRRFGRVVTHPLTGQKIFVSVYSYSLDNVKTATEMEKSNYLAEIEMQAVNQQSQGRKSAMDQAVQQQQSSTTSYTAGQAQGAEMMRQTPVAPSQQSGSSSQETTPADAGMSGSVGGTGTTEFSF